MNLGALQSLDIIETMENYIDSIRPAPEIRPQLDYGYEIEGQSILLHEIRPSWQNPKEVKHFSYAKATFVKSKNIWKVFWKRADLKWHPYPPNPTIKQLSDFLDLVTEDKHHCFKG